jgi:threonine synthase
MAAHFVVECLDCGYSTPYFPTSVSCPRCGSGWREALYDYPSLALTLPLQLPGRPFDLWRYKELLPVRDHNPDLTLGEGGTPLLRATTFGNFIQCTNLFIKDERQNPTKSFKDRQAAVTIAALLESGITEMVVASSGNIALAYAAHAARCGIKVWAFLTSRVPTAKLREILLYGARVVKIAGNMDQTRKIAIDFARQRNVFMDQAAQTVPSVEAMKTLAYETTEQLSATMGPPLPKNKKQPSNPWRAPDWYIQPVSVGLGPIGILKGFSELRIMGLIDRSPAMGLIQPEGCSPMAKAWNLGMDSIDPLAVQDTSIESLTTMDPGRAYTLLHHRMAQESGGIFEVVTDRETYKAISLLARMEGILVEPAAGVAIAGLIKLCNRGIIKDKDIVIVNATGHTMPVESPTNSFHNNKRKMTTTLAITNSENLIAALKLVDFSDTPRVLVAIGNDKTRRIVQLYTLLLGAMEVYEAKDHDTTIVEVQNRKPNLIILDLKSSVMSGFAVLDKIIDKGIQNPIPIIGMTETEFTPQEKIQLSAAIDLASQRGEIYSPRNLDDLRALLQ